MKKQNISPLAEASTKLNLNPVLPVRPADAGNDPPNQSADRSLERQAGLKIIHHFLEEEIQQWCGPHGQQSAYRHGRQPGYIVYAGRKVSIPKPRVRAKDGGEIHKGSPIE